MATASTSTLASSLTSAAGASSIVQRIVVPSRSRSSIVDRFLAREARLKERIAQTPGGVARMRSLAGGVNPQATTMYKHPVTGRWIPPRLSIRAQAELGKAAYREGRFDELIEAFKTFDLKLGAKLEKFQQRIAAGKRADDAQHTIVASANAAQAVQAHRTPLSAEEAQRLAVRTAKKFAVSHGPYRGRSKRNIFKGTKAERDAPARKRAIVEKLSRMDTTISAWRQARRDAKIKAQPKLPF